MRPTGRTSSYPSLRPLGSQRGGYWSLAGWMGEQGSEDQHPRSLMLGEDRAHRCAGRCSVRPQARGPVLTVGVPPLCLHLPVLGVFPAGKAQAAPESAHHSRGIPISKHLRLEATSGLPGQTPQMEQAWSTPAQKQGTPWQTASSRPQRRSLEKRAFSS